MLTKTQIRNTLDSLPENVTVEEVIEHLVFVVRVNKGLNDPGNGRIHTVEVINQKLKLS